MGCVASYPWGVLAKIYTEQMPTKDGKLAYGGNYRKAMMSLWHTDTPSSQYIGFSRTYYWKTMPWMFVSGWIADDLGLFAHWKNTYLNTTGSNTIENMFD